MQEYTLVFRDGLGKGLRSTDKNPRNNQALVESRGAIPEDGVIHALEDISKYRLLTGGLPSAFPFPQIFVLNYLVLVCSETSIYEVHADTLTKVFEGEAGSTWTVADYNRYLVLTNGRVLVTRDAQSGEYTKYEGCDIPPCLCVCDVNGQMFVGAPGEKFPAGYTG